MSPTKPDTRVPTATRAPTRISECQCSAGKPECDCGLYGPVAEAHDDERDERWTPLQMLLAVLCGGLAFWCVVVLVVLRVQQVAA